jgi:hypothetical protein
VQWTYSLNSIRKQPRRISQGKGEKCTSSDDFIALFSDDFSVEIRWSGRGCGWKAGSRSIPMILNDNFHLADCFVDDSEDVKGDR